MIKQTLTTRLSTWAFGHTDSVLYREKMRHLRIAPTPLANVLEVAAPAATAAASDYRHEPDTDGRSRGACKAVRRRAVRVVRDQSEFGLRRRRDYVWMLEHVPK